MEKKNSKWTVKRLIGSLVKIIIAAVVLLFLGLKSLDFFMFTTPADQWYYAFLGFGLTSGGVIAYLIIFMWDADTVLKRTVSIIMLAVCVVGELATAGFGLEVSAWQSSGLELSTADFKAMVLVVQVLGFAHAIALIAYMAGDRLAQAFRDDDGDGIPNYRDPVDNRKNDAQNRQIPNQARAFADQTGQAVREAPETHPTHGRASK